MMLHTKFQGHGSIGSGEEDFLRFLPYVTGSGILGLMAVHGRNLDFNII